MRTYCVYILASKRNGTIYVGVTNNIERRMWKHRHKAIPAFTLRYNLTRLVYFETTFDIRSAIAREKQIKGWLRRKKVALIESVNPRWEDLSEGWFDSDSSLRSE
jgi:putative endonuclease